MESLANFGAVILAAGLSRRMGGPNKLLQPWRGQHVVSHVFETVASLGFADCVAVTGRDADEIASLAAAIGVLSVHNPRYGDGLGGSIAAGVCAIARHSSGIFIVLGDMPLVEPADYVNLARAFAPGQIVIPIYRNARGHPVLFCESFREKLQLLSGDEGARSIVKEHVSALVEVISPNPGILMDFDRPEDFHK